MALWTFRDYTDESAESAITEWVKGIKPAKKRKRVIARWDAFLEHVQNLEQSLWPREWFTELAGFPGIFEMKFTVNNIQYRPLGYYGPRRYEFTFLVGAIEKSNRFVPPNAPRTASEHRSVIEADPARAVEHELGVEDDE